MSLFNYIIQTLAFNNNPYRKWHDIIPIWIKILYKEGIKKRIAYACKQWIKSLIYNKIKNHTIRASFLNSNKINTHHNLIIPMTKSHSAWILGAQPSKMTIDELKYQNENTIHIVGIIMLEEYLLNLIKLEKKNKIRLFYTAQIKNENNILCSILEIFDHSTLKRTGNNITIEEMQYFQKYLRQYFYSHKITFYCHCMAGKSRSFIETIAFIFYMPDKNQLFDFTDQAWINAGIYIPQNLKERLIDNPSISDISEFIQLSRKNVKKLWELEPNQAGLLGLMSLHKAVHSGLRKNNKFRLLKDAQNIGMILKLDSTFEVTHHKKKYNQYLQDIFQEYQKIKINLLIAMITPINEEIDINTYTQSFIEKYLHITPTEQLHFAIYLHELERIPALDLGCLRGMSIKLAKIASKNSYKFNINDQIEFLKIFGPNIYLEYYDPIKKIIFNMKINNINKKHFITQLIQISQYNHNDHII